MPGGDARWLATFAVTFVAVAGALGYWPEAVAAGGLADYCAWRAVQAGWLRSRGGNR